MSTLTSKPLHIAYIGLGSNLENPKNQVIRALLELDLLENSYLLAYSSLYQSSPMTLDGNSENQDNYINAAAKLATKLSPLELLDKLQAIENKQKRVRKKRWGARTIDLDILLYGNQAIQQKRLTVPHIGLKQRDFVLFPLFELNPNLILPDGSPLADLLSQCGQYDLQKIGFQHSE